MADKLLGLRVFGDAEGKMNLALADVHGAVLVVSQFTLYGDVQKGRRPSFIDAAPPELAVPLRSEEHTSELQSQSNLVCRLLLEKKKTKNNNASTAAHHTPSSLVEWSTTPIA